jgi:flagellar basal-body rod protein FlgB
MNDSMLQLLQGYMQVATERQQMIASNMANVDTPGYQTEDINFHQAMQNVMDQSGAMHLEPAVEEVQGLPERPDGNNVNIDRESMLMSETQLQYQMGVQLIKSEFHTWYTAIKE